VKTIELAASLAESSEYQAYRTAKEKLGRHESAQIMPRDFREKQMELERKKINGVTEVKPLEDELRKFSGIVGLNPYIREYLTAE